MKKYLFILVLLTGYSFAQQPVEVTYNEVNQQFQAGLNQLFQNFVNQQVSQGNQVMVTFYDNNGEERASAGSALAPSYLRAISNYKVKFMRDRQLTSTKGVQYTGGSGVAGVHFKSGG